jgi:carbon-monoxide dehydrogenase medium subunit/xanthine dehydrogenase FAD-binding subunit
MLSCEQYLMPASLDDVFEAMDQHREHFRLIAGATDTLPWARQGRAGDVEIPVLIDITRIPELKECVVNDTRIQLGAATPVQRFLDRSDLARVLPCMPRCAVWFADDQIRESATIGGNLVNASPAADVTPTLMAHNAEVELAARRGNRISRRKLPLETFVTGPGKTTIAADEILVAIHCDPLPGYGATFEKVGHRRSLVISLACLAVLVKVDASGRRFEDVRIAVGGVGPVPKRLTETENFLRGSTITTEEVTQAANFSADIVQSRTRQTYRRNVMQDIIVRALIQATQQAGCHPDVFSPELEAAYA